MSKPKFLYDSRFDDATPVASSTAAGDFNVLNLRDWRPYTWWKPSAMPATVTVDRGTSIAPNKGKGTMTTTRAGAIATRVNLNGLIEVVPADTPRFDHDPVTKTPKGLLIEGARTNLLLRSAEFNDASWAKPNVTVAIDALTGPDGAATAERVAPTGAGFSFINQNVTVTSGLPYTQSVYAQAGLGSTLIFEFHTSGFSPAGTATFDLLNGAVTGWAGATITPAGNGWFRCSATGVPSVTGGVSVTFYIDRYGTGDAGDSIYLWGAQFEQGAFGTSYIPTTSAAVTRNADVGTISDISGFFNAAEGVAVAEFSLPVLPVSGLPSRVLAFDDGGTNERMLLQIADTGGTEFAVIDGGVAQASISGGTYSAGDVSRVAAAYKANDFAHVLDGGTVGTDSSGTLPTVNAMNLGHQAGLYLNGHLRFVEYIPKRVSNAELKVLSAVGAEKDRRASLRFDFTRPAGTADSLFVYGHDLATQGATIEVRGSLDNFVSNDVLIASLKPLSDAPALVFFNSQWYRYWRATFTGANAPSLAIVAIGAALESTVFFEHSFSPIDREVHGHTNRNEDGHALGTIVNFESWEHDILLKDVAWSWARDTFVPAWKTHLRGSPFGFIWDSDLYPGDVRLVAREGKLSIPHRHGSKCDVRFKIKGVAP